jgi:CBS domain-containing protein
MHRRIADLVKGERIVKVPADTSVREACQVMKMTGSTSLAVTEGERLLGVFSTRDATLQVIAMGRDPDRTTLADVVAQTQPTIGPDATADEALLLLLDAKLQELAVTDGQKILGLVSLDRLVQARLGQAGGRARPNLARKASGVRTH